MNKKKGFIVYHNWFDIMERTGLSNEQIGFLFKALNMYAKKRETAEIREKEVNALYQMFTLFIDQDTEKYIRRCETNRENIKKRWEDKEQ